MTGPAGAPSPRSSNRATCKLPGCEARFDWARSVKADGTAGGLMPVDADSYDRFGGNLAVYRAGEFGDLHCRTLATAGRPDESAGEHWGMCHWATCTGSRQAVDGVRRGGAK